jgi:hypothetical protein
MKVHRSGLLNQLHIMLWPADKDHDLFSHAQSGDMEMLLAL